MAPPMPLPAAPMAYGSQWQTARFLASFLDSYNYLETISYVLIFITQTHRDRAQKRTDSGTVRASFVHGNLYVSLWRTNALLGPSRAESLELGAEFCESDEAVAIGIEHRG